MMKQNIKSKQRKVFFLLLPILVSVFVFLPNGCGIPNAANTAKAAEKFLGEWQDESGNVIVDIWIDDNGACHGIVCRMGETDRVENWTFDGYAKKNVLSYKECTYSVVTYNEEWEASEDVRYTGGTGKFTKEEDKLTWADDQTDVSAYVFTYVGEY